MQLPVLIQSLLAPGRYGPGVAEVDLVETHISWVLLAGVFAYKIKKPVKLSFLDFSTLELRKHFCDEELRLNQRFSPDIYLEVVGIFHTETDPQWQREGPPLEYAVKMRRFDQEARLDHICARGELTPQLVSGLACSVAVFHANADIAVPDSAFGAPAAVLDQALQNFDDLQKALPEPAEQHLLQALRDWTEHQYAQLGPLLQARKQTGFVRECHGDLHLANMVLVDTSVRLFDCLEFNDELRWIDVASDIAFTYQDLLAQHRPGLAHWFVNEVLALSGDYASAPLLRFYAVYRALVRAKVAMVHYLQHGEPKEHALQCIALAEQLAAPAALQLTITHGVSGCGKTYASDRLLQDDALPATLRLRTDVERKRAFHVPALASSACGLNAGVYSPQANEATYTHLLAMTDVLLNAGWSVLVDGTFLHRAQRDAFRQLARRHHARFSVLAPGASQEVLRKRIQERAQREDDASEASLQVLDAQLAVLEPLQPDEPVWPATEQG
jgi:aminoglycoside phosphotransferase family enzyme/predicted kinase